MRETIVGLGCRFPSEDDATAQGRVEFGASVELGLRDTATGTVANRTVPVTEENRELVRQTRIREDRP